jgi:hypothetical protein
MCGGASWPSRPTVCGAKVRQRVDSSLVLLRPDGIALTSKPVYELKIGLAKARLSGKFRRHVPAL